MADVDSSQSVLDSIDDETANLILELQLLDIQELRDNDKGKGRAGETSDVNLAAALLQENIESLQTVVADRRMTRSIAEAVRADGALVVQTVLEEQTTRSDHALAHRINGSNARDSAKPAAQNMDDIILSKLAGRYVSESIGQAFCSDASTIAGDEGEEGDAAESAEWASTRTSTHSVTPTRRCEACREDKKFFDVLGAPCGHEYCQDCLTGLFEASLTDESLFPPRCCRQTIGTESVRIFLTRELMRRFEEKKIEYGSHDRTYCSRASCSAFIRSEDITADIGMCAECRSRTCTICKAAAHDGDCPQDPTLQGVLDLARQNGWQICYSCHRIVELELGCNHMICRCNAEFCYVCGARWKTCTCRQWDEERLVRRANQLVGRDMPRMAINNPAHAVRVQQAVGMLRERHNCAHERWTYIRGPHQCEECHFNLPQYIFECRQCRIQACNRCRRNRL